MLASQRETYIDEIQRGTCLNYRLKPVLLEWQMFSGGPIVQVITMIGNDSVSIFSHFSGLETTRLLAARWSIPFLGDPPQVWILSADCKAEPPAWWSRSGVSLLGCLPHGLASMRGAVWQIFPTRVRFVLFTGVVGAVGPSSLVQSGPVWSPLLSVEWRPAALPLLCGPAGPGCAAVLHSLAPHPGSCCGLVFCLVCVSLREVCSPWLVAVR